MRLQPFSRLGSPPARTDPDAEVRLGIVEHTGDDLAEDVFEALEVVRVFVEALTPARRDHHTITRAHASHVVLIKHSVSQLSGAAASARVRMIRVHPVQPLVGDLNSATNQENGDVLHLPKQQRKIALLLTSSIEYALENVIDLDLRFTVGGTSGGSFQDGEGDTSGGAVSTAGAAGGGLCRADRSIYSCHYRDPLSFGERASGDDATNYLH